MPPQDPHHDPLTDLIRRCEAALRNPGDRPLWLHWSDVELLKALRAERAEDQRRLQGMAQAMTQLLLREKAA